MSEVPTVSESIATGQLCKWAQRFWDSVRQIVLPVGILRNPNE